MDKSRFNFAHTRIALVMLAACSLTAFPGRSQDPAPAAPPATPATVDPQIPLGATIKKESRLVLVDAVVTDKKGKYVQDLAQGDFKVFEDNKEQPISTFSTGADSASPQNPQKHYLVLFFDNSSMAVPDQLSARARRVLIIDDRSSRSLGIFGRGKRLRRSLYAFVDSHPR